MSRKDAIDRVRFRMAFEQLRERAVSTTVAALATALILSLEAPWSRLAPWFGLIVLFNAGRLVVVRWYSKGRSDEVVARAQPLFAVFQLGPAAVWGGLIAVTGFSTSPLVLATVLLAVGGMMAAGVHSLATHPRLVYGSAAFALTPTFVHLLASGERSLHGIFLLSLGYVSALAISTRKAAQQLEEAIALRFENDDLLEQLRLEKERELTARQAAEKANADKSRFLAAASHDVRQPLHAMGLFLSSLGEEPLPDGARRLVSNVSLAHRSLVGLHEELLEVSLLDAAAVTPRFQAVELRDLFHTLENEATPRANQQGLRLKFRAPDLAVRSDFELLLRVLRNLISNAIRYTQRGGVLVSARRRGDDVLVQVWDTGIGIPESEHAKVFEELHQVANAHRAADAGRGLGLSIVKRLAGLLGFDVSLRSVPGRGTVFSFTLPVMKVFRAEKGSLALVVDDDHQARQALASVLERWGYEVIATRSAEEASSCEQELERLDLVVSDLSLPGDSGLTLLTALRAKRPATRLVLMTGDTAASPENEADTLSAAFLRKPVSAEALRQAITS